MLAEMRVFTRKVARKSFPKLLTVGSVEGMTISAEQLRSLRHQENLTQAELAEKLGVSQRTVVNWESEGSRVPKRSELQVANALRLREVAPGKWELGDHRDGSDWIGPSLERMRSRIDQEGPEAAVDDLALTVKGAVDAVKFAEAAARSGAHPMNIIRFLEATMGIAAETGGLGMPGTAEILLNNVFVKAGDIAQRAIDAFEEKSREPNVVRMAPQRVQGNELGIRGFEREGDNVGGWPDHRGPHVDDAGIPADIEDEWELAAHPKTQAPEDHTP